MRRSRLLAALIATLCILALSWSGLLRPLDRALSDLRFQFATSEPSGRIVVVQIDSASIAAIGTWPWSRALHASIVDDLRALGAADIAFDVDFSSNANADGDAAFEAALARAGGSVILAAFRQRAEGRSASAPLIATRPLERFARNAWEASVEVEPDPDGRVRRLARSAQFDSTRMPSLAGLVSGAALNGEGGFSIDFGIDAAAIPRISAIDLLRGKVSRQQIAGKSIIIGASAVELRDLFLTPRYGMIPGALLQGLAAESLVLHRDLRRSGLPSTFIALSILLIGALLLSLRLRWLPLLGGYALAAALIEIGAVVVQARVPVIVDTAAWQIELAALALITIAIEVRTRRVKMLAAQREARWLQQLLDRVIADNVAGIVVVDHRGRLRAVSRSAVETLGLPASGAIDRRPEDVLPAQLCEELAAARRLALVGQWRPEAQRQLRIERQRGTPIALEFITSVSQLSSDRKTPGEKGQFAVCLTFQDITARLEAEAHIAYLAHYDALTGLTNRHEFADRLARAMSEDERLAAVIHFDLDRFRILNDRWGRGRADQLLRQVAERTRRLCGERMEAARLGADEFAILVPGEPLIEPAAMAALMLRDVGRSYEIDDFAIAVSLSIGVAIAWSGENAESLLRRADAATQSAKLAGGNCVQVYDALMADAVDATARLEREIVAGLKRGEFRVFYQRQIDIRSGLIVGVEALARWAHPERGLISPIEFIPVAERSGLIEPLGTWVLKTACEEVVGWPAPVKVAVNLSAVQFARGDLPAIVAGALAASGLPADRLDLELTETILMDGDDLSRAKLEKIRQSGVLVSLDDFGTGYSSLAYIKNFPIDKIKIDRSFVRDLETDLSSAAIVRAIVTLGQSLSLRVIAEGVETDAQLAILRGIGCDEAQGFLHGKAEPAPAIIASLVRQSALRAATAQAGGQSQETACASLVRSIAT